VRVAEGRAVGEGVTEGRAVGVGEEVTEGRAEGEGVTEGKGVTVAAAGVGVGVPLGQFAGP